MRAGAAACAAEVHLNQEEFPPLWLAFPPLSFVPHWSKSNKGFGTAQLLLFLNAGWLGHVGGGGCCLLRFLSFTVIVAVSIISIIIYYSFCLSLVKSFLIWGSHPISNPKSHLRSVI